MAVSKAGPGPLSDLGVFLRPFGALLRRSESRASLERYTTGFLADVPRKTASDLGRSLPAAGFGSAQAWSASQARQLRRARPDARGA